MRSRTVYIYGSHIAAYSKEFTDLTELDAEEGIKKVGKSLYKLVQSKKSWKLNEEISETNQPKDECYGNVRTSNCLNIYSECRTGRDLQTRLALMQDEVLFQYATGSIIVFRFDNVKDSVDYYEHLLDEKVDKVKIFVKDDIFKLSVGDIVEFKKSYVTAYNYEFQVGDKVRVFACFDDCFIPTCEEGKNLVRIPNSGGAKLWLGACLVKYEDVVRVKDILKYTVESN